MAYTLILCAAKFERQTYDLMEQENSPVKLTIIFTMLITKYEHRLLNDYRIIEGYVINFFPVCNLYLR